MMKEICFLFVVLFLNGCSNDEIWESSDYFIGKWEREFIHYGCCEGCEDNYEEECVIRLGPLISELELFANGKGVRVYKDTGNQSEFEWCYNANIQKLVFKEVEGPVINFDDFFDIDSIGENSFRSKNFIGTNFLQINRFERIE